MDPQAILVRVVVEETERAVNAANQLVANVGGYIVSQSLYDDEQGYRYASMRLAVPVDRFEESLRVLRGLGTVTSETASGRDVTDEYVDLGSRLDNLKATRARLQAFLEQAETLEETLRVNEELKAVEEQIAVIEGRRETLRDRAAFSTIDLTIEPFIPTPTPTPTFTPTPTPTATPLPTANVWRPQDTAKVAAVQLQDSVQETADFTIYYGILCGPWLALLAAIGYGLWWLTRRLQRRERTIHQRPAQETAE